MRRIFVSILFCLNIVALCVSLSCCSDIKVTAGKTYISFSSKTRTVFPKVNNVSELGRFTLYEIAVEKNADGETTEVRNELCTWLNYTDFAQAQLEIEPGVYSFVLDSSYCGTKYVCRLDDVEIAEGEVNRLDFVLKVKEYSQETKGSVDIALLLPANGGYAVKACLLDADMQAVSGFGERNIAVNEYASGGPAKAFYTEENVPSGFYFVKFSLFKDGCPLNYVFESVTVADSLVSEGCVELTAAEIDRVYYVELIIPSDAVLKEGNYGCCYSRRMGISLPVAEDFTYDGYIFDGWKEVVAVGDNFCVDDSFSYGISCGSCGNREFMAFFSRIDDENGEQGGQTPLETDVKSEEEQTVEQGGQTPLEEEVVPEEIEPVEQGGQTPQETDVKSEEQGGQTPQETDVESEEQQGQTPVESEETKQINSISWEDYYRIGKIGRFSDYALGSDIDYIGLLSYDGKTLVTALENSSCQNNVQLEIPEGIEKIGTNAFMNSLKISTAVIGPDVKCMEPHAFKGCQNMYAVTLPENCDWYACSRKCSTDEEILACGTKISLGSIWNTALLLKSDYESSYWYKIEK